jgi:hypothetical protein
MTTRQRVRRSGSAPIHICSDAAIGSGKSRSGIVGLVRRWRSGARGELNLEMKTIEHGKEKSELISMRRKIKETT